MEIILLLGLFFVTALQLLHKTAFLQQKDYWRGRVFADKNSFRLQRLEYLLPALLFFDVMRLLSEVDKLTDFAIGVELAIVITFLSLEVRSIFTRSFRRPKITLRSLLIISIAILIAAFIAAIVEYLFNAASLTLILISEFSLFFILLSNEPARQIVYVGHRRALRQAGDYLAKAKNAKIIGITGSYGKSTTKGFLNTILSESHKVISTPGSINTDIGLATFINREFAKLSNKEIAELDFVVLEMDAYVVGTIARIVKHFPLDMAIVTSINEQHLDTFGGDIQNTVTGNYQIIEGLKENGDRIAVFNADNEYCMQMAEKFKREGGESTYLYSEKGNKSADVLIKNAKDKIEPGKNSVDFSLIFGNKLEKSILKLSIPVLGIFNAVNYGAAALIAKIYEVSDKDITAAAKKVTIKEKTLGMKYAGKNHVEIIDDSFNANPASVRANLEMITQRNKTNPARNIIIFTGLFDLGPKSQEVHEELGKLMSKAADEVIIVHPIFAKELKAGGKNIHEIADPDQIIERLEKSIKEQNEKRILIMNRIPVKVYKYIQSLD